ncbi:hypothetical protein SAMN05443572_101798 [Myxococcus fulvus]|uniref:Triacylglycerol lipase n=1 Tax=Myxococcus fulvus TaxID=33 RepID=A0A511SUR0_MYXFU|nr:triacylglycerol lipase [Myxococcus fulvus]GEN05654.1 hypothetical protein MFU01_06910 [Myxococcus fulvus]SES99764.1 hypothetical protein SAMN05443572_101798 [Myxococcus fulvus]
MAAKHHIYLVPGFFGFINLGELVYFGHALDYLKAELARRGMTDSEVTIVLSHPTASIRTRTADLLKAVQETAGGDDGPIHLVGHSTGGLDARLFASPGAQLAEGLELEPFARRVRSVVTVSTPHAGTPLASFFLGLFGQRLLKLLSLFTVYVLRFGRLPLRVVFRFGHLMARADDQLGWKQTLLDQLYDQLLGDFSSERRDAVSKFLSDVGNDTSLIPQLTPEGIDLFNASTVDRPGVRYGSVVTQARPPSLRTRVSAGLDPYAQLTHTIYAFVYGQTQRMPLTALPLHSPAQTAALVQAYGAMPGPTACDGIVPTRSQVYGRVLAAVRADHLDAIGHFDQPAHQPPHVDWLISGSGFRRPQFEATWKSITDFIFEDESR